MSDNFDSWTKLNIVGAGGFGVVWRVRTDKGDILAAKYVNVAKISPEDKACADNEIRILPQLSHPNVVRFVTVKYPGDDLVVFTELIDGKDLAAQGKLSETVAKGYLRQICSGLNYLHTRSPVVLHRDIKGPNIMVNKDGTVKLIDFGLSLNLMVASGMAVSQAVQLTVNAWGTLPFMAPELFIDKSQFSTKSDVWALGITIYEMLTGAVPYGEYMYNTMQIIVKITGAGAPPLPASGCSDLLRDFYARCTAKEARDRPSVSQLLQHPFLA